MKLKHIFAVVLGVLAMASCDDDKTLGTLGNIELDKTFVTIPATGGDVTVTVKSSSDWAFDKVFANVYTTDKKDENGKAIKETRKEATPTWLKVSTENGAAGETKITLHADATSGGRDTQLEIVAGNERQYLQVQQGDKTAETATCAQIIAGPDGKTFRATGVVEDISSTTYGNWYLNDGTGRVYIYGTLDKNGAEKNFASLGIENSDQVTIEGPKTTYGSTVELVNVTVIKIVKSLIKVEDAQKAPAAKEGGDFVVKVSFKGKNVAPVIPEDAQSWLGVTSIKTKAGVASKTQKNPADTAVVTFHCQPNTAGARSANVTFTSGKSSVSATVSQEGSIQEATLATFKAAEEGKSQYRITAIISKVDSKGNFWIQDYTDLTGSVEAYRPTGLPKGAKVGDIVTVTGTRSSYKGNTQIGSPAVEKLESVKAIRLAEFDSQADGTMVLLKGRVEEVKSDKYGNLYISDGTSKVYVYGLYGYGAPKGADRQDFMKANNIAVGSVITVVGQKITYNGTTELNGGYFVSMDPSAASAKRR